MAFFVAQGRLLATFSFDRVKQKHHYRLLGGHVEFGERAETALKREIMEEVGADIEVLGRLDVVENCFTYEGERGHEVVFIYHARFLDDAFNKRDEIPNIEPGVTEVAKWVAIPDLLNGSVPLYPPADYRRFLNEIGVATPA